MLKNYFTIAWRNMIRNKSFSAINLLGLAIGMAATGLILLWVQDELSWNRDQQHYDRVYQVYANRDFNGNIYTDGSIFLPAADALEQSNPQVEAAVFTSYRSTQVLGLGDKKIKKSGLRVSPHFFKLFSYSFIAGSPETALANPDAILLTESAARAFFGNENPVDKVLRLDNQFDVKVTGVIRDVPASATLQFDYITPFNFSAEAMQDWNNSYVQLFVLAKPKANTEALASSMNKIFAAKSTQQKAEFILHPMSKWRLYSDFNDGKNTGGMIEYVRLFTIVAIVILLIACINFMNLSTARSEKRAKEVGIRKTLGSEKKQLVFQFFAESVLMTVVAFILAIGLIYLSMPAFNALLEKKLQLDFSQPSFWLSASAIVLFTGLFAGSYPALYLSSFNPIKVLKGTFLPAKSAGLPRRMLVVGQFVITMMLVSATLIIYRQVQYVKARDIGYNPANFLSVPSSPEANRNFEVLKQEMIKGGFVAGVTRTSAPLTEIWNFTPAPDYEGKPAGVEMIVSAMGITGDFTATTGAHIVAGRDMAGTPADSSSLLLNEAAVKTMGLKQPVGMRVRWNNRDYTVIGVTANMVMASPYTQVDPMVMAYRPNNPAFIHIRLKEGAKLQSAIANLEQLFHKYNPSVPFEYQFIDQQFNAKFITEELISKLINVFAGLAIFISCLGLSGLAAYTIRRRAKEIGIRKILGANLQQLLLMLSREFVIMVLLAMCIAIPLTWWGMSEWLQQYAYRIQISIWSFIAAAVGVLLLTILTVWINVGRAALTKPVKSIRTE